MSIIGAKDEIDDLLVKKYANLQVNKIENTPAQAAISADKVLDIMNDYANLKKIAMQMDQRLSSKKVFFKPVPKYN